MDEMAIERHSFNVAKERLKEFTEKTEAELEIAKVQTKGGFLEFGGHKVTGYELNNRLEAIQENLIYFNNTSNDMLKEFREVYGALDALDRDYITSIVANVKAIEKTSNDVRVQQGVLKKHNEKLANQQNKLDVQQAEIEKNVSNISKIVAALKVFKEKLEGYKHLTDIDKTWNDCKAIKTEISVVSDSITKLSKEIMEEIEAANKKNEALSDQINRELFNLRDEIKLVKESVSDLSEKLETTVQLLDNQLPVIQETASYIEHLKIIAHIDDIDPMWNDLNVCKKNIENIDGDIQAHQSELESLTSTSEEHTSKLVECEKKEEELIAVIQKNKEEANENIAESVQNVNTAIESLAKKVKYAYWIAGGTAGLAVIELILLLMKVM